MSRNLLLPVILAGAVGIPFLASQDSENWPSSDGNQLPGNGSPTFPNSYIFQNSSTSDTVATQLPLAQVSLVPRAAGQIVDFGGRSEVILPGNEFGPDTSAMPLAFMPVTDLSQVFRFDATVEWIKNRWDRVSIFSAEPGITAYRCDLVTGVNRSDIHGCITYFINSRQGVERISFRGWSGDAQPFVEFCVRSFKLKQETSQVLGLYVNRSWGRTRGALILQNPTIARHDNPNQTVAIYLEACSDLGKTEISQEMRQAVEAFKQK